MADTKVEELSDVFEVFYHPGFLGRALGPILMLEDGGTPYKRRSRSEHSDPTCFAWPFVRRGDKTLSQTMAIMQWIGRETGYDAPEGKCDETLKLALDLADVWAEVYRARRSPDIAGTKEAAAKCFAAGSRSERWFKVLEACAKKFGGDDAEFFFGSKPCFCDFALLDLILNMRYMYGDLPEKLLATAAPTVAAIGARVEARPNVMAFLDSDRNEAALYGSVSAAALNTGQTLWDLHEAVMRFLVLTVGTRGDVQPFVALGKRLVSRGHRMCICTSGDFRGFIEEHGLDFAHCGLDTVVQPKEWLTAKTMSQMVKATADYLKGSFAAVGKPFWEAAREYQPDCVLVMTLTVGFGKNIAEKLAVPCWMTGFTQTVVSGYYNEGEYMPEASMLQRTSNIARAVWAGLQLILANRNGVIQQFADWRKDVLEMEANGLLKELSMYSFPLLSAISPSLFPIAPDFKPWMFVTGFWFLDAAKGAVGVAGSGTGAGVAVRSGSGRGGTETKAAAAPSGGRRHDDREPTATAEEKKTEAELLPPHLQTFLARCERKPVCVNFGSMVAGGGRGEFIATIASVVLHDLGMPCVLVAGWNNFGPRAMRIMRDGHRAVAAGVPTAEGGGSTTEASIPGLCCVRAVPHEALFPHCSAVVYHGGSGTVARVVQAGVPSVVVPILKWSDQPKFGAAVEKCGVGSCINGEVTPERLRDAIAGAVNDASTQRASTALGRRLNNEHGVMCAVAALESCLCKRVKPGTSADVEFCQRHCLPCTILMRRREVGVKRTPGWVTYYEEKPKGWGGSVCMLVLFLLVAFLVWRLFL